MCILFATRRHPNYELIMVSNRDEFYERGTHGICWHSDDFILSPYDTAKRDSTGDPNYKETFGTWCGINRKGRVASLLNLQVENCANLKQLVQPKSRGVIPYVFLSNGEDNLESWDTYDKVCLEYPDIKKSGDFNFFYGDIRTQQYRLIDSLGHTFVVLDKEHGMDLVVSNDLYSRDKAELWDKIKLGQSSLNGLLREIADCTDENTLLQKCFVMASSCAIQDSEYSRDRYSDPGMSHNTIFVPPLKHNPNVDIGLSITKGQYYGTKSQMVLLVDKQCKHVTVVEHVLYTSDTDIDKYSQEHPKEINRVEFDIV